MATFWRVQPVVLSRLKVELHTHGNAPVNLLRQSDTAIIDTTYLWACVWQHLLRGGFDPLACAQRQCLRVESIAVLVLTVSLGGA